MENALFDVLHVLPVNSRNKQVLEMFEIEVRIGLEPGSIFGGWGHHFLALRVFVVKDHNAVRIDSTSTLISAMALVFVGLLDTCSGLYLSTGAARPFFNPAHANDWLAPVQLFAE